LTHSLKVAQVARGLCTDLQVQRRKRKLGRAASRLVRSVDPYAAEAAALAHDLGHPPFGHIAEKVLQERSGPRVSFEGNPQSFRIVTRLALRSVDLPGLNLTKRTLNGLLKYPYPRAETPPEHAEKWGAYDSDSASFEWAREGLPAGLLTLEAALMDWADDVTYAVHDMDDFFRAGIVPLDRLTSDRDELAGFQRYLGEKFNRKDENDPERGDRLAGVAEALLAAGDLSSFRRPFAGRTDERIDLRSVASDLISRYIGAVELEDADEGDGVLFRIPKDDWDQVQVLKQLTWYYVINRPSLVVIQRGQTKIIETLYELYRDAIKEGSFHVFPPAFAERAREAAGDDSETERVAIDLIAGMTEASATEIYKQEIGVSTGSLLMRAVGPT
jgi:dGTPase